MLQVIKGQAAIALLLNSPEFKIYYTGHGSSEDGEMRGAWCTADGGKISFKKVVQAVVDAGFKGHLYIWCDSCFAGNWAKEAQ